MCFKRVFFLLFFLFTVACASKNSETLDFIQKNGYLTVCSDAGFPPFESVNASGLWEGYDVDVMRAFAHSLGVSLQMQQTRFEGIIPALMAKKCDMIASGLSVTPERSQAVLFSTPVFQNTLGVVVRANEKKQYARGLKDLDQENTPVVVKIGTTSDFYVKKNMQKANVLRFDTHADILTAVQQQRAAAFVGDLTFVDEMQKKYPGVFSVVEEIPTDEHFALATRLDAKDLMDKFNQFFTHWSATDDFKLIYKGYFPSHPFIEVKN